MFKNIEKLKLARAKLDEKIKKEETRIREEKKALAYQALEPLGLLDLPPEELQKKLQSLVQHPQKTEQTEHI